MFQNFTQVQKKIKNEHTAGKKNYIRINGTTVIPSTEIRNNSVNSAMFLLDSDKKYFF